MGIRDPFTAPPVESRRGGPAKAPLSREAIVEEALRQIGANGLHGMSLRKVAAALETGPASLYAYVADLQELHALVLDRALQAVDVRGGSGRGWRGRLMCVLESYAHVLAGSPGLAKLAFGTVAVGPNALRIAEAILAVLDQGGVEVATAAWALDLLLLHVTATVAEHADGLEPGAPEGPLARAIAGASEQDYPHLHAARAELFSGTGQARFTWAIDTLLRGIEQAARPTAAKRRPAARTKARSRTRSLARG